MSDLTPEMREALDRRGDDRMSAYFFGFDSTTSDAVNDVLAAVAFAGKAFHSTEQWGDDDYMPFTMVDLIQATANEAAGRIEELTAERDALRETLREVLEALQEVLVKLTSVRVSTYEQWLALLDPEDGERGLARREDPVHLDAFRQACVDVLGEDPFAPEDGERTTCATCDNSGMVSISGRPEDGPDPCPDCWPEDGERDG